ncbi:hypothetical protein EW145_g6041 [Phellinidium pouzarii]|uniref:Fungal-type protein kinase domain-containing protein n=1 Tax=Phellinidium pouzarii TaxID=167371 RepID=A0A4S4KXX3_9AGAM|nr:hypothetical protein EW145_g6041 [Phellinidium pouzarii]
MSNLLAGPSTSKFQASHSPHLPSTMYTLPPTRTNRSKTVSANSHGLFLNPKTPRRKTEAVSFCNTPLQSSSFQNSDDQTSELSRRQAIPADIGHTITEVDLDYFLKCILPPLPAGFNLDDIVESLRDYGHIINGTWEHFKKEPKSMKCKGNNEEKVFEHLRDTFDSIVKAANKTPHDHKQTLALHTDPYITPTSEKASTTKPDGSLMLKESENKVGSNGEMTKPSWYDYAVTLEAKKSDGSKDLDDDIAKEIFNMQHVMSLDPCRRFTFGITIENNNTRLWFCSRAVMMVSKPFNFRKDLKTLTRVFLSFAFASKTELGWDPTVSVSIENGIRVYHFTMDDEVFSTVKVMSDVGADAVIGRASRVFKVKRSDGTLAILKDVWVDDDRELEHVLHEQILDDVEKNFDKKARKIVKKHLMTPMHFGLVKVDGQTDHTTNVIMRGRAPSFINTFPLVSETHRVNEAQQSIGHSRASDRTVYYTTRVPQENARKYIHHRHHYRVVFKEIGETLRVSFFDDLKIYEVTVAAALEYIHGSGWVHRDISVGNTYLYNKRGILGDLEYAKKRGVNAQHEVRTGTLDFMAVEIAERFYKFLPIDHTSVEQMARKKMQKKAQQYSEDEREYSDDSSDDETNNSETAEEGADTAYQKQDTVREIVASTSISGDHTDGQNPHNTNGEQTLDDTSKMHNSSNRSGRQDSRNSKDTNECPIEAFDNIAEELFEKLGAGASVSVIVDEQKVKSQGTGVWYNTLHDMESMWWIAVWKLFLHEDLSEKRTEMERIFQAYKANLIFPHLIIPTERFSFLANKSVFADFTSYLPDSFKKVVDDLNELRTFLLLRYTRAEVEAPDIIDEGAFKGVHDDFITYFKEGKIKAAGIVAVTFKRPNEKSNDSVAGSSQSVAKRKAEDERPPFSMNDTSKRRRVLAKTI